MTCMKCDSKKRLRREMRTIKFEESGLDYITLVGVPVYHCNRCGETYREIPRPKQLLTLVAKTLVLKKNDLTPAEFIFLRKYLGFSRTQIAKRLRYSYDHVLRMENGDKHSAHLDGTLRTMVIIQLKCSEYESLDEEAVMEFKQLTFNPTEEGWVKAA